MSTMEYAFQGNVEFDLAIEMLGERVTRRARAVYHWTPEWEFLDPKTNAPRTALLASMISMEVLTEPGEDDDEPPAWAEVDIAEIAVLPQAVWDRLYELIDAKCKTENAARRRAASN